MESDFLKNKLLAALPRDDFELLIPHLKTHTFDQGHLLIREGQEVTNVHFPHSGMMSLLVVMSDGRAVETSVVGREGVVGAMAGLGLYNSLARAVVQIPLVSSQITAAQFRRITARSSAIRELCVQYNENLLARARISAACNALHTLDQRFCRWLLHTSDHAESATLAVTQEAMAEILGVTRTSITDVAGKIQISGAISYSRGVITILDRDQLETRGCECYRMQSDI